MGSTVTKPNKTFARGVSDAFVTELASGRFAGILERARDHPLDVQIREHYIDFYADGCCVLQLRERPKAGYEAAIHEKYVGETRLPGERRRNPRGICYEVSDAFVAAYLAGFATIMANARALAKRERTLEERIIRANNGPTSPVVFFDRQVQMHGVPKKADLLGLLSLPDGGVRVLLTEIKQGQKVLAQSLIDQTKAYYEVFAPAGRLRECLANAYRKVISQKQELGLLPAAVAFPSAPPPVECLVVLCERELTSKLLLGLRTAARAARLRAKLVCLSQEEYVLPPPGEWRTI